MTEILIDAETSSHRWQSSAQAFRRVPFEHPQMKANASDEMLFSESFLFFSRHCTWCAVRRMNVQLLFFLCLHIICTSKWMSARKSKLVSVSSEPSDNQSTQDASTEQFYGERIRRRRSKTLCWFLQSINCALCRVSSTSDWFVARFRDQCLARRMLAVNDAYRLTNERPKMFTTDIACDVIVTDDGRDFWSHLQFLFSFEPKNFQPNSLYLFLCALLRCSKKMCEKRNNNVLHITKIKSSTIAQFNFTLDHKKWVYCKP